MSKSTNFYLDMFSVMVFWPTFLGEISDLYIHRSPSILDWTMLISSGMVTGFALMRIRSTILGDEKSEPKIVARQS